MSELKARIKSDTVQAMKAGDKPRRDALRLIGAAIKQREVDQRIELDDAATIAVLDKMAKQRRDSISQYREHGRDDLADAEVAELEIIRGYLPQALDDAEIDALIGAAIEATGAAGMRDMGKVMGQLKPQVQGRADMSAVGARLKARLSG